MMPFYIDPGTGSMLFTVLIGILGTVIYGLRALLIKIRFFASGGNQKKVDSDRQPFVIYSDSKRYWNIFGPICREFDHRGQAVTYLTASPDDPALSETFQNVKCEFIGEGNRGFARLNLLKADVLLSTTPGLEVYQWKRSREVRYYVHILHAPNDALYRMYGLDYYDAVLLSGAFQGNQIRELEALRGLPAKDLKIVGMPYLDEMRKRLQNTPPLENHSRTVLLAPTWGATGILSRYGTRILDALLQTGYHIIIRPHPQSFASERDMLNKLMSAYPESEVLEWNRDNDNFDVLNRSDIMISDFSGVIFDYCLVFRRPVIYADITYRKDPYDSYCIKEEMWTLETLPKIGKQLSLEKLDNLKDFIDECVNSSSQKKAIDQAIAESWANIGNSTKSTVEYLIRKQQEIAEVKENDNI